MNLMRLFAILSFIECQIADELRKGGIRMKVWLVAFWGEYGEFSQVVQADSALGALEKVAYKDITRVKSVVFLSGGAIIR